MKNSTVIRKEKSFLLFFFIFLLHSPAYEDGTDRVPKRRQLELRRRAITRKEQITEIILIYSKDLRKNILYYLHL